MEHTGKPRASSQQFSVKMFALGFGYHPHTPRGPHGVPTPIPHGGGELSLKNPGGGGFWLKEYYYKKVGLWTWVRYDLNVPPKKIVFEKTRYQKNRIGIWSIDVGNTRSGTAKKMALLGETQCAMCTVHDYNDVS